MTITDEYGNPISMDISDEYGNVSKVYKGRILESVNMIDLPTDPIRVANLLDRYAKDWEATLDFLCTFARTKGIEIERNEVIKILSEKYKE